MASADEYNGMNNARLFIPAIKAEIKEEVEDSTLAVDHYVTNILATDLHSSQQISCKELKPVSKKHYCKVCNKTFLLKKTMKQHYRMHMVEKHYKCSICSVRFTRNYLLLRHIKTHSQINLSSTSCVSASRDINIAYKERTGFSQSSKAVVSYGCPICSEIFPRIPLVNRHAKIHSVEMPFKCRLCINRFSSENDLLLHAVEAHDDKEPYGCHCCSKKFGLQALLEKHLLDHSEDIKSRDEEEKNRHKCQFCIKCFKTSRSLVSHIKGHLRERPYQCHLCSKTFKKMFVLNQHYMTHTGERPHECNVCKHRFARSSDLKRHVRIHCIDTIRRDYQCTLCRKSFMDQGCLTKHLGTHVKKYKCKFCRKPFSRNYELVEHVRQHTGEKPLKCLYCQFSCARRKTLSRHEIESHGIKDKRSHKCPHCSRSFKYLFYLQGHLKREHEHTCTVCQLSLTSREELIVHMDEHTREQNKCQVCGMTFMSEFGLKVHMRVHTGEKQLKCNRCKVLRLPVGVKQKPCLKCANLNKETSQVPFPPVSAPVVIEIKPGIKFEYE